MTHRLALDWRLGACRASTGVLVHPHALPGASTAHMSRLTLSGAVPLVWRLIRLVCGGPVATEQAQREIAADWIAAYGRYCPTDADCPAYRAARRRVE